MPPETPPPSPQRAGPSADWIPLGVWLVGFLALGLWRAQSHVIPQDLSAYVAAAERLAHGASPYLDIENSPYYQGFPYLYFPGLHPLLRLLALLPLGAVLLLEAVVRGVSALLVTRFLAKKTGADAALPWPMLLLVLLCFDPFVTDLYVGNLEWVMFSLTALVLWRSTHEKSNHIKDFLLMIPIGALLLFKPMWGIPAAYIAALERRWSQVAGLATGALLLLVSGVMQGEQALSQWSAMIGATRAHWEAFDLGTAHPLLALVAFLAWSAQGYVLWRRRDPDAWLWAFASPLWWPRLGFYCYVSMLPLIFSVLARRGRGRAALVALPYTLPVTFLFLMSEGLLPYAATPLRLAVDYLCMLAAWGGWLLWHERWRDMRGRR